MNFRLLLSFSVLAIFACKTNQIAISEDFNLKMEKGACFGSCPVYSLEIDNQGNALYDGKRFTDKSGVHKYKLSTEQFKQVTDQLTLMNFFALQDNFKSNVADLPTVTIAHTHRGLSKSISGKDTRPKRVLELQKILEEIAQGDGWVSVEPISPKNEDIVAEEEEEEEAEIIEREMIIHFKPSTIISRWMRNYREFQMYVKKPLTDDKKTWVVQYNTKLINPQVLLHKVQSDPGVESAEFNTKAEAR